jgi:hypothetical protein
MMRIPRSCLGSSSTSHNPAVGLKPLLCVAALGLVAVASSQPVPSFPIQPLRFHSWPFADMSNTRVAFGPDVGLAVWRQGQALRGARIDRFGSLLDTTPLDIDGADSHGHQDVRPGVCWGENEFLVVWCESDRAMCAVVRADGGVETRSILQDSVLGDDGFAAVAFDGTNFLASWETRAPASPYMRQAFFRRVSPSGSLVDSEPRRVAPGCVLHHKVHDVTFYGNRYLVLWRNYNTNGFWGSLILPDGTVPDSQGFLIRAGGSAQFGSVTHDSRNFIVAWNESPYRLMAARVTDSGQVLDTAGVALDTFAPWWTSLVSSGDTTLVVFCRDSVQRGDSLRVVALRVDTALNRLDSEPVLLSSPDSSHASKNGPTTPSVTACGSDYLVAWAQPYSVNGSYPVHAVLYRQLGRQGQLPDSAPMLASYSPDRQEWPRLASDGSDYLAVWLETRRYAQAETIALCGARLTAAGAVLDSQPIRIVEAEPPGLEPPRIAHGGGCYLTIWRSDSSIYGRRISPAGALLDTAAFKLTGARKAKDAAGVAYGDSAFLVAWNDAFDNHVHGIRITPSYLLLDTAPLLLQAESSYQNTKVQVTFDGVNFLVTRTDNTGYAAIRATRVSPQGDLLDRKDFGISGVLANASPLVAYGAGVYLVTPDPGYGSFLFSRFGAFVDSVHYPYYGRRQIGFDGLNFLLMLGPDSRNNLTAMRISPGGRLLDSMPYPLVSAEGSGASVVQSGLALTAHGGFALVFQNSDPEPALQARIRAAVIQYAGVAGSGGVPLVRTKSAATVVRGVLVLGGVSSRQKTAYRAELMDVSGCKVMNLRTGANDVRGLAPGVYFVRDEGQGTRDVGRTRKVVVTR